MGYNIQNGFNSFSQLKQVVTVYHFISFPTAFVGNNDDYSSATFTKFRGYRATIANRLASQNQILIQHLIHLHGFPIEYGVINGDTVVTGGYGPTSRGYYTCFLKNGYSGGKNPNAVSLSQMPKIPLPNWRITYDGLIKIKAIKKYFKTFSLGHAYRSILIA